MMTPSESRRRRRRRAAGAVGIAGLVAGLAGCSLDAVIWGADGARVIDTSERLIDAAGAADADGLLCSGAEVDLGEAADWRERSAGEPARFSDGYWPQQAGLDPAWNINLENLVPGGPGLGATYPGDVFYRETDDGLCVIDIAWSTVVG